MRRLIVVAALAAALAACSGKSRDELFLDEVGTLSKEEIMERADKLASEGERDEARRHFTFLADSFPNDPVGRQAALKVADSFFAAKDAESLAEAQLRYKDFSNRFPNDPNRAYALLQLGKTYSKQRRGPQRDLTPTREAAAAFMQVLDYFPGSPYAEEAKALLADCHEELARHELEVAKYYFRSKAYEGAHLRLTYLTTTYPDSAAAREGAELLAKILQARAAVTATTASAPR